jgi:hypothetical protein
MKLYIKYCGGCNPVINRKKLVNEVVSQLKQYTALELTEQGADVGLVVGGCPVCCVNLDEIKAKARSFVLVGGELVNGIKVPPEQQAGVVVQQILKSADHNRLGEVS